MHKPYLTHIKPMNSEIAFINAKPPIIAKDLYYIEFVKSGKSGFYLDNKDYLFSLNKSVKWNFSIRTREDREKLFLEKTNGYIKGIEYNIRYYSYIKVLKDSDNPQFEGQIMLLRYGKRIKDFIQEHLANGGKAFDRTFRLITEFKSGFPSFDKCHFTDKEIEIVDDTLDLNSEIYFKTFNLASIQRKDKLEKIQSSIF